MDTLYKTTIKKDFDSWNKQKKEIHNSRGNKLYNSRDIWWCSLGLNIGKLEESKFEEIRKAVKDLI